MYDPEHVAAYYASLFAARTDAYSRWTPDGWRPTRAPLTGRIVSDGLTGKGPSISGYLIAPGSTSHVVAVDLDLDNGLDLGFLFARKLAGVNIPAYVESSRRGAHVWIVLDDILPAIVIRAALRGLLQHAQMPEDPKIELRPGSDTIADDGLGHALRLPLMPHPLTGKRGAFRHADGTPVGSTVSEIILNVEWASAKVFAGWAERWRRPGLTRIPKEWQNPRQFPEDDSKASDILRDQWNALDAAPGKVISCPAKEYHSHGDIHKGLKIMADDRRAFCHKTGCILNNDGRGRGTYELRKLAPHG